MKVITLRKLPPALARAIRRRADEARSSVSKTVIKLLEESVGIGPASKGRRTYHDLDALSGAWTKDETATFDKALATQRTIDRELWMQES